MGVYKKREEVEVSLEDEERVDRLSLRQDGGLEVTIEKGRLGVLIDNWNLSGHWLCFQRGGGLVNEHRSMYEVGAGGVEGLEIDGGVKSVRSVGRIVSWRVKVLVDSN
ncbi:hypothetical protein Tco_1083456 [Tanacetum coccineum]